MKKTLALIATLSLLLCSCMSAKSPDTIEIGDTNKEYEHINITDISSPSTNTIDSSIVNTDGHTNSTDISSPNIDQGIDTVKNNSIKKPGLNDDSNIATTFASFLQHGGFGDYSTYYIYDIDQDGCEELIVIDATCEADAQLLIYRYEDGELVQVGDTNGGHCSVCGNSQKAGVTIHYGHQGIEWIDTAEIKNGSLAISELVSMREVQDYTEFDYCIPLECYSIDDITILKNYGGADTTPSPNAININLGLINTSANAFLQDHLYNGGNYLKDWENSFFTSQDRTIYNLSLTGTETNYYLYDQFMTVTARGDTIVGVSQEGFQVSTLDNTYQLLKWLGGNAAKLLDYDPEIYFTDQYKAYLKWEVNNGYMVIYTSWWQGLTDWKNSTPWSFCIFAK